MRKIIGENSIERAKKIGFKLVVEIVSAFFFPPHIEIEPTNITEAYKQIKN